MVTAYIRAALPARLLVLEFSMTIHTDHCLSEIYLIDTKRFNFFLKQSIQAATLSVLNHPASLTFRL